MERRALSRIIILVGSSILMLSILLDNVITNEDESNPTQFVSVSSLSSSDLLFAYPPANVGFDFSFDDRQEYLHPEIEAFLKETPVVSTDPALQRLKVEEIQSDLDITVQNSYTKTSPIQTGKYAYPWNYIAEPYKATVLAVVNGRHDARYKWIVDGHIQGYGSSVGVLWTSIGWKRVILIEKVNGTTTSTAVFNVIVKYVRREIRSVFDRDRETFFQAAMILQRVPTEVGIRVFGSKYLSKDHLSRVHLYYGGSWDCDHWHQGAGFVTSHVAFTLQFEQSLQTIYPEVTTPYWDFTLESTLYEPQTWRSSMVFADDWFGKASPDNILHTVVDGRWAFAPAKTSAAKFSDVHNSYGVLRAPWNNDPTPFMTRNSAIYGYENNMKPSGCQEYAFAMRKTSWMSFSKQLNSAAHGHIHETVGGSWNQYFSEANDNSVSPAIYTFAHEIQALSKELWRADYIQCPESCSMDVSWQDCKCECSPEKINGKAPYDILNDAGVLDEASFYDHSGHLISSWKDDNGTIYYTLPGYTEEESLKIYEDLLYLLCDPGHIGDMYQATSTNDITFWVLHPTVDRLWHFKRLGDQSNFNETWDPYHPCYCHNPTDYQPFQNLFDNDTWFYTNMELYEKLSPSSPDMPYIYDNFYWPHCDLIGETISNQ
mmetsp:Transcript_19158/g.24856  ORF Transcript_19158/g.24856 Transcript_19158/m.24856 type:complete len:656 (-) Transcript_19158:256-2223(-)